MSKIKQIEQLFNNNYSVTTLFDPIQTHALSGVQNNKYSINEATKTLRKNGANKFRKVVASGGGTVIICFNADKMFND